MSSEAERGRRVAKILRGAWRPDPLELLLPPEDVASVAPLLLRLGCAGLAWWRLRTSAAGGATSLFELRQAYRLTALQAALHERQVARAFALLRTAGVEPVLGKGWAIARLYPSPGLRSYGDVDLYVSPADAGAARAAFATGEAAGCPVDLHAGFAELGDRDAREILRRSQIVVADGVEVRVLGAEDHLRLLALHMMRHGILRPTWLCDVALALESRPPGFDWEYLTSGDRRRTDWFACALGLAHALLGASMGGVPAEARRERLPRWLVPSVLRSWGLAPTPQGARTPMALALRTPARLLAALRLRWPNAVEATVGVSAPMNDWPRLPFQVGASVARAARFVSGLPRG